MATPRKDTFDPHVVGIYHCMTRCVRQLFLLGRDKKANLENAGRWQFCVLRLEYLAGLFAIDVLDFALLSNHIHTLLRNRPDVVSAWSDREVVRRWFVLHPSEVPCKEKNHVLTEQDIDKAVKDHELIAHARRELSSLSHFQKCLLEPIAKEFNRRDEKKGHFVAERFRCKRIDCDGGLLACSVYIALNPFRAGLGDTLHDHPFSSYSHRYRGDAAWLSPLFLDERAIAYDQVAELTIGEDGVQRLVAQANLHPSPRCSEKGTLPLHWLEYQEISEWTAEHIGCRRGLGQRAQEITVPKRIEELLQSLGIDPKFWLDTIDRYAELFHNFVALPSQMETIARRLKRKYVKGVRACRTCFIEQAASSEELSG
ncbi:MAG: hypothetical protein O2931_03540 [Planctomycetota bacterium]|nr:hypothetical protein [Planctomycetota bacterium]